MIYTSNKPPVIIANLGSTPWSDISTVIPWIEYVVISDATGTLSEGDVLTLTGTDPHLLSQLANTPMWLHKLGNYYTVPDTGLELAYYITHGDGGELVEEGTVSIQSLDTIISSGAIIRADLILQSGVEIPSSASVTKNYPIKFIPYSASGDIQSIFDAKLTITPVSTGIPVLTAVSMTDVSGEWNYTWAFPYASTEQIYNVKVDAHLDNSGTNFKTYPRIVESFKRKEYRPMRIKQGFVR